MNSYLAGLGIGLVGPSSIICTSSEPASRGDDSEEAERISPAQLSSAVGASPLELDENSPIFLLKKNSGYWIFCCRLWFMYDL